MALIHVLDKQTDDIIATLNSEKGEVLQALLFDSISNVSYFDFTATKKFDVLEKRNRVLVRNQDGIFNEFIITYAEQYKRNEKRIKANASYTDLSTSKVIEPATLSGSTSLTATSYALSGTEWQPGDIEYTFIRTVTIEEHTDPLSFLKLIASTFELEITYRIEVSGNRITGRYVDMKRQAAGFEGKEIVFGKDLINIKRIEDSSNIVTALQGIGPDPAEGAQRLTVLVTNNDAFSRWGRKGQHLIQSYSPESSDQSMTLERLRQLTENELLKRIDALVSYECEAASIEHIFNRSHEKIRKGQTVRIKDLGYNPPLYLEARIDDIEIDPLTNRILNFKIGNFTSYSRSDLEQQIKNLRTALKQKADAATIQAVATLAEANRVQVEVVQEELTLQADQLETKVSEVDYTGNVIASLINESETTLPVSAEKVELEGHIQTDHINASGLLFDVLKGGTMTLGGIDNGNGRLTVLDSLGEVIADLDSSRGGFDELYIGKVNSPSVLNVNKETKNYYIDPINGNDENVGDGWARPLKTVQSAIDRTPKYNEGFITIYLHAENARNFYEDIKIRGFTGPGGITIDGQLRVNTLSGSVTISGVSNIVTLRNFTVNSTTGKGIEVYRTPYAYCQYVNVYGQGSGRGFYAEGGTNLYLNNCQTWDSGIGIYSVLLSKILVENCIGLGTNRGIAAQFGGEIRVTGTFPNGTVSATYSDSGGTILGVITTPESGGKGTIPPIQYTKTVYSASGSNFSEMYNNWESGSVKQGNYGYGNRKGAWFFGTSILDTIGTGKSIKAMRVYITRTSRGGVSGTVRHSIRGHGYATQPGGNPSLSNEMVAAYLSWGQSAWINIPSTWWANFANGTYKGFGLYTEGSNYSICSTSLTLEITYQ